MIIKTGRMIGRDRPLPPIEVCKDVSLTQAETTRLSRRNLDEGGNGLVSKPRLALFCEDLNCPDHRQMTLTKTDQHRRP
jgi:hypothetical protein